MYSVNLNVHDMMVCINIKRKPLKTNVNCDVRKPAEAIGGTNTTAAMTGESQ